MNADLQTLAVANYRSLLRLVIPLGRLNVITGANGSGKSNLYRALRLLADTARDGVVGALAREGGMESTLWAGPESITMAMRRGEARVMGGPRREPIRLRLGFATEQLSYAISLGLPVPGCTMFNHDPEIKNECIWSGPFYRAASSLVERRGASIKLRSGKSWQTVGHNFSLWESMLAQIADPAVAPVVFHLREVLRGWRFYDQFRIDADSPARTPQIGTRTPVLHHDGRDLAAAVQTIREVGDGQRLDEAVRDAFPGGQIDIAAAKDGRFALQFQQEGLLRPLAAAELSDGTLRYLLWVAALLTPRPPSLMALNEPENSLHTDLLPALARLIASAAANSQIWVISHSGPLIAALQEQPGCRTIALHKELGQTRCAGQRPLDEPAWHWPD